MENFDWPEWQPLNSPIYINTIIKHGYFPNVITQIELIRNADLTLTAIGKAKVERPEEYSLNKLINLKLGESFNPTIETIGKIDTF